MKANPDKCHLICSKNDEVNLIVENEAIHNSKCRKLLGVNFDFKLNFNLHIKEICKKAGLKLNALSRITPFMDFSKKRKLVNAFFLSQFNYCPLVWMCHNHTVNNQINRLHERCLRLTYNDRQSSYDASLKRDGSVSIYHRNIRTLAIEMFKVLKGLSPAVFNETFPVKQVKKYNLRHTSDFSVPHVRSINYGFESLAYLGPKIWELIPSDMKEIDSLNEFKNKIKHWKPESCPCRLCKLYIGGVGYF